MRQPDRLHLPGLPDPQADLIGCGQVIVAITRIPARTKRPAAWPFLRGTQSGAEAAEAFECMRMTAWRTAAERLPDLAGWPMFSGTPTSPSLCGGREVARFR